METLKNKCLVASVMTAAALLLTACGNEGLDAAVNTLSSRGVSIDKETFDDMSKDVCESLSGGSSVSGVVDTLSMLGASRHDAQMIVDSSIDYRCQDYAG